MTDQELFTKYQKQLVWFINTKIGRWFFKVDKEIKNICNVAPNALTYDKHYERQGNGEWREVKTTCFRTNNKYARILNYRLAPLHKLAFILPSLLRPELSPLFVPVMLTVDTYYSGADGANNPVCGHVGRGSANETWATILAGAGNNTSYTDSPDYIMFLQSTTTTNQYQRNQRGVFLFNTAGLPDDDQIDSAVLSLYGNAIGDSFSPAIAPGYCICASNPASTTALADADYGNLGTTAFSDTVSYANLSTSAYVDFTLNASGKAAISKTGISKFGGKNSYDMTASAPTWSSGKLAYWAAYMAASAGTTYDPKLTVTHSVASYIKTINGLARASVKTVNGLATASVKTWDGLA